MDSKRGQDRESRNEYVDFSSVIEYDHLSDDDVVSECSCSTCSTCSTCEICEDGEEIGESDEEFDISDVTEQDNRLCYHNMTDSVQSKGIPAAHIIDKRNILRCNETKARETEHFIIEKFENHMVLKADASHVRNEGINSDRPSQELLLGGNRRKKKVTFLDSSSSSDDVASGELASISGFSDSSNSDSHPAPRQNGVHLELNEDWNLASPRADAKLKNSQSEGEMEREYYRLKNVLKTFDPLKLHVILKHALKSKDPEVVGALATLLPKSKFTADTVHCVRCHKEYDPHFGRKKCVLYHPEKSVWKVSQNSESANFECSICSKRFRWKGAWEYKVTNATEHNRGVCFEGVHTPSPDEVSYQPTGAAQCCEDKGCIVFYV